MNDSIKLQRGFDTRSLTSDISVESCRDYGCVQTVGYVYDSCSAVNAGDFLQISTTKKNLEPCKPIKQQKRRYKPSFTL